jgi:hypothetical protein
MRPGGTGGRLTSDRAFVAFALKRRLSLEAALILIMVGGGFGLALSAMNYLG